MDLKLLHDKLTKNIPVQSFLIFTSANKFIIEQYIHKISQICKKELLYVTSIKDIYPTDSFFDSEEKDNYIKILKVDTFESLDKTLYDIKNVIVIADSIEEETNNLFHDYIINFPAMTKSENFWMIQDYVYSIAEGIDHADLDWLIYICNFDLFKIQNELDKLILYAVKDRKEVFTQLKQSLLTELSVYNIFDLVNAIIERNKKKITEILDQASNIDLEPTGLVTLLYNNFLKIIKVQMSPGASAEALGLSAKQLYAIKYRINKYSCDSLVKIFQLITSIDKQLKTGKLPADLIIDYLLINIL